MNTKLTDIDNPKNDLQCPTHSLREHNPIWLQK